MCLWLVVPFFADLATSPLLEPPPCPGAGWCRTPARLLMLSRRMGHPAHQHNRLRLETFAVGRLDEQHRLFCSTRHSRVFWTARLGICAAEVGMSESGRWRTLPFMSSRPRMPREASAGTGGPNAPAPAHIRRDRPPRGFPGSPHSCRRHICGTPRAWCG